MAVATEKSVDVSKLTLIEMKENRDQESSPYIVAYFEIINHDIYLSIENVGKGLAKNVKIDIKPELRSTKIISNDSLSFIREGISSMPPKYKIKTLFDSSIQFSKKKEKENFPSKYNAKISYHGGINESKKTSEHILDITPFYDIRFRPTKNMADLVDTIKTLNKTQKSFQKDFYNYKDNVSRGLWIKNPIHLTTNINPESLDLSTILSKLNEFKNLWESVYLKENEDVDPFYTDIRNSFIMIGYQLITFSTYAVIPIEFRNNLLDIGTKTLKLGRFDDYDVWDNQEFIDFGNEINKLINGTITKIEILKQDS
jgi:hypothetical protein